MRKIVFFGLLASLLALGIVVVGCDDGNNSNSNPESVTYTSYDTDGNVYTLVVTENPSRAFTPQEGDSYVLTIKNSTGTEIGKSTGSVKTVNTSGFTLEKDGSEFSVNINGSAIASITDNIPLDGGGIKTPPVSLTPTKPDTGADNGNGEKTLDPALIGKWEMTNWETTLPVYPIISSIVNGFEFFSNGDIYFHDAEGDNHRTIDGWHSKDNVIYSKIGDTAIYSYSIDGNTLTLTYIHTR